MDQPISEQQLHDMATIFKAMGEVSRLALLRELLKGKSHAVGELADATGLSQANVSKHLKQLALAGLVSASREGNFVRYEIAHPLVKDVCTLCCSHLEIGVERPTPKLIKPE